ncbi:hypothetical protein GVN21_13930 [Caulobacter sp. SLTY]|uniref:hypothetical protein n=1 Tax=Caulobacter sp. SLTY TaxID=2683262 RepID=UPI0014132CF5|nr:hypothetical protein [Caulobacter sp. SLTY]NBB16461.1 hypothetical protein [Caulobacter sp. SLTY]
MAAIILPDSPEGRVMLDKDAELAIREARLVAELAEVRADRSAIARLLGTTAVEAVPANEPLAPAYAGKVKREPRTWREFISTALRTKQGYLTKAEFVELAQGTEFGERFEISPNGYYNTIKAMEVGGELVKVGKRFYAPETYAKIQSGEIDEAAPPEEEGRISMPKYILEVIGAHGGSLSPAGVISALQRHPDTREVANRNPALVRTHLSKMKQRALLVAENGRYKLPDMASDLPSENITLFPGASNGSK